MVTPDVVPAMIDAISAGIALANSDGTVLVANRPMEDLFGYLHGELHGLPVERLVPVHLEEIHRRHRTRYDQAPAVRPKGTGTRLVGLRKDGSSFPAEISLSLQTAAQPGEVTASERIAEALSHLDDVIGKIRNAALTSDGDHARRPSSS